ncbi:hypothetical protein [Chromohalobacter japonicus]|uniref:hypothetical protein n=1 Tax=Chromohalobacter japonicus TaxID=223900 RepID=UPI001FF5E7ED|nr:hypothetical protein [Chromohalobacter japonicus]MCK0751740.1 hypothetical protein [Chromohalobacter japonicus]
MSVIDRQNLNTDVLAGDARTMVKASVAMHGIVNCLRDGAIADNEFQRNSLLTAMELVADGLEKRAEFLQDKVPGEVVLHD